jgi:hypothetical protein
MIAQSPVPNRTHSGEPEIEQNNTSYAEKSALSILTKTGKGTVTQT